MALHERSSLSNHAGLQQERKRDAVVDPYRRHVYSIRRVLLEADLAGLDAFVQGYCSEFVRDAMRAFDIGERGRASEAWQLEDLLAAVQGAVNGDASPSLPDQQARFRGEGTCMEGPNGGERSRAARACRLRRAMPSSLLASPPHLPRLPQMPSTRGGWTPGRGCIAWP